MDPPSNGFINASEAMVADAPAKAKGAKVVSLTLAAAFKYPK